jgi:hypothetical protein
MQSPINRGLLALLLLLPPTACALADGFVIKFGGSYVREEEQRAFIDWSDGQETLYVATRTEATDGATLWLLPVPAAPEQVQAEPVELFPHVTFEQTIAGQARAALHRSETKVAFMDVGVLSCFFCMYVGGSDAKPFMSFDGYKVHSRVERLGMIVETLTAQTPAALDRYLATRQLEVTAANITGLAPYLRPGHTLVCGWRAEPTAKDQARALRIQFPAARVFFPLKPSQVYASNIESTIYVRGGWRQPDNSSLAGVRCQYVTASVSPGEGEEPLTRVQLPASPKDWTDDLELETGAPLPIYVAPWIIAWEKTVWGVPLASGLLGALLCLSLPWLLMERTQRRWPDYAASAGVGLGFALTVWCAALLFWIWQRRRRPPLGFAAEVRWWAPRLIAFAGVVVLHVVVYTLVCQGLVAWLRPYE